MKELYERIKNSKALSMLFALLLVCLMGVFMLSGSDFGQNECDKMEKRCALVLEQIQGAGKVRVMIYKEESEKTMYQEGQGTHIIGVVVVAEGAKDLRTALSLKESVCTLFHLEEKQVKVFEMEESAE